MPSFEDTVWHCSRCGTVKTDRERNDPHVLIDRLRPSLSDDEVKAADAAETECDDFPVAELL